MAPRSIKRLLLAVIALAVLGIFGILYNAFFYAPTDEVSAQPANIVENSPQYYPVHISIPKINVEAKVTSVGITKKGNMATPPNFTDVGWYKYGVVPGALGSAVLAGHVNNGLSFPAVFFNLNKLSTGDDVYVNNASGQSLHFKVIKIETFDFNAKTDTIFGDNSGKLIKLITCTGVWLEQFKTHNQRLVVTAELVEK